MRWSEKMDQRTDKAYLKITIPVGIHRRKKRPVKVPAIVNPLLCATCYQPRQLEADDGQSALFKCKNPMCIAMKKEC